MSITEYKFHTFHGFKKCLFELHYFRSTDNMVNLKRFTHLFFFFLTHKPLKLFTICLEHTFHFLCIIHPPQKTWSVLLIGLNRKCVFLLFHSTWTHTLCTFTHESHTSLNYSFSLDAAFGGTSTLW